MATSGVHNALHVSLKLIYEPDSFQRKVPLETSLPLDDDHKEYELEAIHSNMRNRGRNFRASSKWNGFADYKNIWLNHPRPGILSRTLTETSCVEATLP